MSVIHMDCCSHVCIQHHTGSIPAKEISYQSKIKSLLSMLYICHIPNNSTLCCTASNFNWDRHYDVIKRTFAQGRKLLLHAVRTILFQMWFRTDLNPLAPQAGLLSGRHPGRTLDRRCAAMCEVPEPGNKGIHNVSEFGSPSGCKRGDGIIHPFQ